MTDRKESFIVEGKIAAATAAAKDPNSTPRQLGASAGVNSFIDRLLAAHPNASAALLDRLSHGGDLAVRRRVAKNPNASAKVLLELAQQVPADILKNPSFDALVCNGRLRPVDFPSGYLARILRRGDCLPSLLRWAAEHGTSEEKLAVAKHLNTPNEVLQSLAREGGIVGKAAQKLRLDKRQVLNGPYSEILDLRKHRFETKTGQQHRYERSLEPDGTAHSQPDIRISGSDTVEVLYFPSDTVSFNYAVIEDLPNLRELHVISIDHSFFFELKWLVCRNLPRLQRVTVSGGINWLQLEGTPSLTSIDAGACEKLDYFSIEPTSKLKHINIAKCRKLRDIIGLKATIKKKLNVVGQIEICQKESRRDYVIYKNMTYTDVDMVLSNLDKGAKEATRQGLFRKEGEDDLGFCEGLENDGQFKCFVIKPLPHNEAIYSGGDIFSYSLLKPYNYQNEHQSVEGFSSPEQCLDEALEFIIFSLKESLEKRYGSAKKALKLMNELASSGSRAVKKVKA